jgi:hypothetical protein
MKFVATCVVILYFNLAYCQSVNDTIFFKNGTIVIGKIEKIKLGVVTFDPNDANDITVQLRKLKTIAAGNRLFRVESVDHQVYFGRILKHPVQRFIYIADGNDSIPFDVENISNLYPLEKSVMQRFSGSVGLGYSYTRSSGLGRLNFNGDAKYTSRKSELGMSFSGIYTIYDSLFSRDKEDVAMKYNYYFIRNWFATAFLAYQRNLELGLEHRFQVGLGIGNKFLTQKNVYGWARSGVVINQENSTEGTSSGILTELYGQVEINLFKFEKPEINILLEQTFYYSLSQSGRFRNDGSLTITWEIFKDFNLNFEPYNNYDSKPPSSESHKFDYGLVFGINYVF